MRSANIESARAMLGPLARFSQYPSNGSLRLLSTQVVLSAASIAREIRAKALIIQAEGLMQPRGSDAVLDTVDLPLILIARGRSTPPQPVIHQRTWISIPAVPMTRTGLVKVAVLVSLARGLLRSGDRIATKIGVEGRAGRAAGALLVIGDLPAVESMSQALILNPFQGYPETARSILHPSFENTLKAYASLDGAVLIRGDGVVVTAGVQLVPTTSAPPLPHGLGTRHAAAAAITACSEAVAITVSETTGTVSVFKNGRMITDIHRSSTSPALLG